MGALFGGSFRARFGVILEALGTLWEASREALWDNLGCLGVYFWKALWLSEGAQEY